MPMHSKSSMVELSLVCKSAHMQVQHTSELREAFKSSKAVGSTMRAPVVFVYVTVQLGSELSNEFESIF